MTSVVVIDGGGNVLEYVTGDEEAQQVRNPFTPHKGPGISAYILLMTKNALRLTKRFTLLFYSCE